MGNDEKHLVTDVEAGGTHLEPALRARRVAWIDHAEVVRLPAQHGPNSRRRSLGIDVIHGNRVADIQVVGAYAAALATAEALVDRKLAPCLVDGDDTPGIVQDGDVRGEGVDAGLKERVGGAYALGGADALGDVG